VFSRTTSDVTSSRCGAGGFTVLEIIVVLAVLAALGAIIAPSVVSMLTDADRTRAHGEAAKVASAMTRFVQDTGLWPFKNNTSANKVPAKQAGDFECLFGSQGSGFDTTSDGTAGDTWTSGTMNCAAISSVRDTIENHLITNTPAGAGTKAYVTTGGNAWRGPYLLQMPADPWGNAFLVNVAKGDPALSPKKAVFVISAGPNGILETTSDALASSLVTPAGDDIIERIQ
jgi:type II secretory pathway pseudopilin PulG